MQTCEVLNRAADLIEERGWSTGVSGWGTGASGQPLCMEGGILAALGTNYVDVQLREWFDACPAYMAVASYLDLPGEVNPVGRYDHRLWAWNDARTASEVIEVLRACAVIEASREREAAEVSA